MVSFLTAWNEYWIETKKKKSVKFVCLNEKSRIEIKVQWKKIMNTIKLLMEAKEV